jgi:dephospho-CoA kinase
MTTSRTVKLVGLTGGIGAGKSTLANALAAVGVPRLDVDEVSRASTMANGPAIPEVIAVFGRDMIDEDGALDRRKMRSLVFVDTSARQRLEAIIHPIVRAAVGAWSDDLAAKQERRECNHPYAVLEVPLLFERLTFRDVVWRTLVVDCDTPTQIARVQARSQLSAYEVERIIASQIPRAIRLQLADDVFVNSATHNADANGRDATFLDRVNALHQKLGEFANADSMRQNDV